MSLTAALLAGSAIGVRHSLEADHVAAVAALVDEKGTEQSGVVGILWGAGHGFPIADLGALFLFAGTQFPDWVSLLFEVFAGVILILLGGRLLYMSTGVRRHTHDSASTNEAENHDHDGSSHTHTHFGSTLIGLSHSHRGSESFGVGIVHGLAGSGGLIVLLVSTAPTVGAGLSFLGSFILVSILTMGVLAFLWGQLLTKTHAYLLQIGAGLASISVGLLLLIHELLDIPVPLL